MTSQTSGGPSGGGSDADVNGHDGNDEIWQRAEPDSPCVKICVIHPKARLCIGCLRTPDEIAQWSRLESADRQAIMASLPARSGLLRRRKGGRTARMVPPKTP